MNKLYTYFENLSKENKISQAFLIGNVVFDEIKDELENIFSDFFFKNKIKIEQNPEVIILKKEDNNIGKEDIKELLKKLSTTSQYNGIKIYIIDGCEYLNSFAYNAILKTLEEPQKGIYAFLITNNIDNVISTIVSRCNKIFISSSSKYSYDEKYMDIAKELIDSIEQNGTGTIVNNYKIYNKIEDRKYLENILKCMLKIYKDNLYSIIDNSIGSDNSLIENNINLISKKILVINDNINKIGYNLNKNLSIDRLIIELWRCNK